MTEMELMERMVQVEGCTKSNTRRIEDLEQRARADGNQDGSINSEDFYRSQGVGLMLGG